MINSQLAKGTLMPFLRAMRKAEQEERFWEMYLHSFSEKTFDQYKEEVIGHGE